MKEGTNPQPESKSAEAIANAEKLTNLQTAIGDYSQEKIEKITKGILEKFAGGDFKVNDPEGYTHSGVAYRNFIYSFTDSFGSSMTPEAGDDLNYALVGIAIKKAMEANPDFDKFVRDYIKRAQKADADAWNKREETYNRYIEHEGDEHPRKYLLDPNDDRYHQGSTMAKFILGEI
ncbi:MAG: hypothetical protein WCO05_05025 [Candidatus Moraniibacteriota bacterium]